MHKHTHNSRSLTSSIPLVPLTVNQIPTQVFIILGTFFFNFCSNLLSLFFLPTSSRLKLLVSMA
uniref:Putative ovule protein n=1 Tax=Solanum chacoense TaxID=4108 RepID=A0A0V0HCU6_SOLCH